jgi:hypothetical protein
VKKLTNFFKKLRLRQILTVFLAGMALFITTACNSGDINGARPNNPPVQAGGQNNPMKAGGDGYTDKTSTDASVNGNATNYSTLPLIAANDELLYPGSTGDKKLPEVPPSSKQPLKDGNSNNNTLERVGEAFKDASSFITDKEDKTDSRSEPESKAVEKK